MIYLRLFLTFLKIGAVSFGGGYGMISLIREDCLANGWLTENELLNFIAVAESTPGPIAINCATYIGFKKEKILGSVFATLGMVIPSFAIIYLISLFFNQFLSITWVASAFRGIQVCVVFLILSAGLKTLKKLKKSFFTLFIASATFICMIAFSLFAVDFSSIFYILISGSIGLLIYAVGYIKNKKNRPKNEVEK
jgi:chromate transporter